MVFIIRHSERTDDTGPSGHLTDNGKKYARDLGARIAKVGTEDFYFGYSGYTRTYETCENIAQGKGQVNYSIVELPYMDGAWYVKDADKAEAYTKSDGGGWVVYSKYGFTGAYPDAFYDLETRSEQLLKDQILANIGSMKRVNVMCTHDYLVVPPCERALLRKIPLGQLHGGCRDDYFCRRFRALCPCQGPRNGNNVTATVKKIY